MDKIIATDGYGLGIIDIEHGFDDKAIVKDLHTNKVTRNKIYYTENDTYFIKYGKKHYLSNFLKVS